jgi:hypothetical protein
MIYVTMHLPDCYVGSVNQYMPEQPHLREGWLYVTGLYVMRFALADGASDRATAISPARVNDIDLWKDASHVSLSILDADFREESSGWAVFQDGEARVIGGLAVNGVPVEACYVEKPYNVIFDRQASAMLSGQLHAEDY